MEFDLKRLHCRHGALCDDVWLYSTTGVLDPRPPPHCRRVQRAERDDLSSVELKVMNVNAKRVMKSMQLAVAIVSMNVDQDVEVSTRFLYEFGVD